jgi:hypothetical protein
MQARYLRAFGERNAQTLIEASKEVGLEVHIKKSNSKYTLLSSTECTAKSQLFWNGYKNQNLIQERNKRGFYSDNACYCSVQNLLSSRLLSENIKIRIYKNKILLVVLYECET